MYKRQRLQYPDEITGELLEIRVMADQWRDHSWLESLPGPPDYDHKRAGLDQLQRAILAISENVVDEVLYRATGWRENADGTHRFIHRRGAITPTGHEDVEVAFSGPIERYYFPDPIREAKALRTALQNGSATMLDLSLIHLWTWLRSSPTTGSPSSSTGSPPAGPAGFIFTPSTLAL